MKTTYTIIRASGMTEKGEIDWPMQPGHALIKPLVESVVDGPLERVAVLHPESNQPTDMFVDEMGHLRAEAKPFNEAATKIYRAYRVSQGDEADTLPTIAGDVVLFDRRVWF